MAEAGLSSSPAATGDKAMDNRRLTYFRPLRHRDFRLLVIGQTASTVGDLFFVVAFPFLILDSGTGVVGLAVAQAVLGGTRIAGTLLGGMVADRLQPRTVMLVTDTARAAVLCWLAYALAEGRSQLWQFVIAATVIGLLEGLFLPAYRTITPAVLPDADLAAGNSVGEVLNIVAALASQLIAGGALALLGRSAIIGIDAGTFVISALMLLAMRPRPLPTGEWSEAAEDSGPGEAGVRERPAPRKFRQYVMHSRLFATIAAMTGIVSITASGLFAVGLPILADHRFSNGAEAYGILLVGLSIGRLIGSVAAGRLVGIRARGYLTIGLLAVHGAVLVFVPALHALGALLPALVVLGFADGTLLVIVITVVQQLVPREMLGRSMAVMTFMQTGSFPISVALAGLVVDRWGLTIAFAVGGAGVLATALLGACQRTVRHA
jgi:MFS family permease